MDNAIATVAPATRESSMPTSLAMCLGKLFEPCGIALYRKAHLHEQFTGTARPHVWGTAMASGQLPR